MIGHSLRLALIPAYLVLCLVLGGASAAGYWANMALQLLALPIIFWALVSERTTPMSRPTRSALGIVLLMILVILIQLVPLPPSIWRHLPGRPEVARGFELLGRPLPWLPLSLEPYRTIASALWLLPSLAVLLGIVRLGAYRAAWIAWAIGAVTVASVSVAALQLAGGEQSPSYFYEITNFGAMTGFFANANHFATLLVCAIPFLTALYLTATAQGRSIKRSSGLSVILAGTLAMILVGISLSGSLAAIGLSVPAFAASLLMIVARKRRLPVWSAAIIGLLLLGSTLAMFSSPFANNLTSQQTRGLEDSRRTSFSRSIPAAEDFFPVGSGLGTFQQIYSERENPATVSLFYMNHVHSDYIELALETGLPGYVVLILFLIWWVQRTRTAWKPDDADHFTRAASIASAVILAHSLVDYPLRTAAVSALFAACCGLLAEPRARVRKREVREGDQALHLAVE